MLQLHKIHRHLNILVQVEPSEPPNFTKLFEERSKSQKQRTEAFYSLWSESFLQGAARTPPSLGQLLCLYTRRTRHAVRKDVPTNQSPLPAARCGSDAIKAAHIPPPPSDPPLLDQLFFSGDFQPLLLFLFTPSKWSVTPLLGALFSLWLELCFFFSSSFIFDHFTHFYRAEIEWYTRIFLYIYFLWRNSTDLSEFFLPSSERILASSSFIL